MRTICGALLFLSVPVLALSPSPPPAQIREHRLYLGFEPGQLHINQDNRESLGQFVAGLKGCGTHWSGGTTVTIGSFSKADPSSRTALSVLRGRASEVRSFLAQSGLKAANTHIRLVQDTDPRFSYYPNAYGPSRSSDFMVLRSCCSLRNDALMFKNICHQRRNELFDPRLERPA
jgi:hypothetical protein